MYYFQGTIYFLYLTYILYTKFKEKSIFFIIELKGFNLVITLILLFIVVNCLTPTNQFMIAHFLSFSSIASAIGSLYLSLWGLLNWVTILASFGVLSSTFCIYYIVKFNKNQILHFQSLQSIKFIQTHNLQSFTFLNPEPKSLIFSKLPISLIPIIAIC